MRVEVLYQEEGKTAARALCTAVWDGVPRIGEEIFFGGRSYLVERVQWDAKETNPYIFVR